MLGILLIPEVHKVDFHAENRGACSLEMLRPARVLLDLRNLFDWNAFDRRAEHLQLFCEGQAHHVRQRDVDIVTFRPQEL